MQTATTNAMPTRMIREAILNSERFLSLPDNTERVCYVACLLTADDRGNLEGGSGHLVRLWRDFGVDDVEKAERVLESLAGQDLARAYEKGGKRYVHLPRFGQRMRSFKRACPASPWCDGEQKEPSKSAESTESCQQLAASRGVSRPKRSEEKGSNTLAQFERFWATYPRKVCRSRADKAWRKLNPSEQLSCEILQAVERAKTSADWRRESGKFIPYPATWLNDRRWEDEAPTEAPRRAVV